MSVAHVSELRKPGEIPAIYIFTGAAWLFILVFAIAGYCLTWWEISNEGLKEHRIWKTKFIPWDEVYRVGLWRPHSRSIGDILEIEYARTGPMSDRGSITLSPLQRNSFLDALRTCAPQAAFDL